MQHIMTNEALWGILLVLNFILIVFAWKVWGRAGLWVWIAIAGITANLQVSKTIELFGLTATLGNIVYAGSFLATDILSERFGKRSARTAVWIGFFSVIAFTGLMQIALLFEPAPTDAIHSHLSVIFGLLPRIVGASLAAYLVSQLHDVWAFQFWKRRFPGPLWIRNNLSTGMSQLLDSLIFTLVAFYGVFEPRVLAEIVVTTYLLKLAVAVLDTPFLYLALWIRKPQNEHAEDGSRNEAAEDHSDNNGDDNAPV